jgi:hypothetical protein
MYSMYVLRSLQGNRKGMITEAKMERALVHDSTGLFLIRLNEKEKMLI